MITSIVRKWFSNQRKVGMQNFFEINPIHPSNAEQDYKIYKETPKEIKPLEFNFKVHISSFSKSKSNFLVMIILKQELNLLSGVVQIETDILLIKLFLKLKQNYLWEWDSTGILKEQKEDQLKTFL